MKFGLIFLPQIWDIMGHSGAFTCTLPLKSLRKMHKFAVKKFASNITF